MVILNIITQSFDITIDSGICVGFNDEDKFAVGTMDDRIKLFDSNFNILWEFTCCEERTVTDIRVNKEININIIYYLIYKFYALGSQRLLGYLPFW